MFLHFHSYRVESMLGVTIFKNKVKVALVCAFIICFLAFEHLDL